MVIDEPGDPMMAFLRVAWSKIQAYWTIALGVLVAVFFGLWQFQRAARANEKADRAEAAQKKQTRMAAGYRAAEKEFNEKVQHAKNTAAKRGRFTDQ